MYLVQTFKFRYGELTDLFLCNSFPQSGVRCLKERYLYFLYIDGKLSGPYKTPENCKEVSAAFELMELVHDQKVLVIEPRQVAQEVLQEKLYLRIANYDDMCRNTIYYEYVNKNIYGPYYMQTDISEHDIMLINKLKAGSVFIIYERQNMPL